MQMHNKGFSSDSRIDQDSIDRGDDVIDIDQLISAARRQWRIVAISAGIALVLGFIYAFTAVPLYTAKTSVLIDRGNSQIVDQLSAIGSVIEDEASILSQVELLKSDTILNAVVDKLDLIHDPVFNATGGSLFGSIISSARTVLDVRNWFRSTEITDEERALLQKKAADALVDNMGISRVGRTYVLDISYTSPSPQLSAKIAGAIADAYLTDKLDSKYDATRRAGDWLQKRIEELRQQSLATDLAVQKFRSENGLVATNGGLISDQQLTQLNAALIVAQAETAKARARYERIQSIIANGQNDAIVTDVLDSSISNNLREKYLDASKREAEIADRLGPNHAQAVRLRGEMKEYERLMFEELGRIAESYQSELEVAESREKNLTESVAQATGISATANETQVQLRELEREAETYKNLYQTFLQRYQESVQQQSFPITEARIISRATAPTKPSHPRKSMVLALSFILGCAVGGGIGAFREFRDRFFRTGEQVRDILGQEFLGIAPLIDVKPIVARATDSPVPSQLRLIKPVSNVSSYVVDNPLSSFAETLRSAKIAADLNIADKPCPVIGVVSVLPGEGKSTVSINMAQLLANQGSRTLLIDADLRNPGATRQLAGNANAGLLQAVLDGQPLQPLLLNDPKTRMVFLPAVVKHRVPHSSELLTSPAMSKVLATASANFDYVVVDLPPLGPVIDARAMASKVDGFIFVVEWGKTSRNIVRQTLETEPQIARKCLGVVLNKVDSDKMKLYREYGSSEYYYSRYSAYYRDETTKT